MKTNYELDGLWYHGGGSIAVNAIYNGTINTELGGGELGRGFYIGNYGHVASAWAKHKNSKDAFVVSLEIAKFSTTGLKKRELSWLSAKEYYINIRRDGEQRIFEFKIDVVAAPIVGRVIKSHPIQLKWEGTPSQKYLNSSKIKKELKKL